MIFPPATLRDVGEDTNNNVNKVDIILKLYTLEFFRAACGGPFFVILKTYTCLYKHMVIYCRKDMEG